ncbi:MAG: Ku protein [Alphaproteobacteria bacterium]|nr:Ku protein [Alphaproteobacteria bacterium]
MAIRPTWQGHLRLSLVTCPVALYPTVTAGSDVRFHLINPDTNNRVKMIATDAETGDPLERSDLVKGYEIEKDSYVLLDNEDFDAVKLESTKVIDIEQFVPAEEIDRLYLDRTYCLVPEGKMGADAFAVIRDAMKKSKKVAVGRIVLANRERIMALEPRGAGILATSLRAGEDVRDVEAIFEAAPAGKPDKEMIAIAERIIAQKEAKFDPERYEDRYEKALRDLISAKSKGKKLVRAAEPEATNVIDLMDALKKSLGGRPPAAAKRSAAKHSPAKRTTAPARKPAAKKRATRAKR